MPSCSERRHHKPCPYIFSIDKLACMKVRQMTSNRTSHEAFSSIAKGRKPNHYLLTQFTYSAIEFQQLPFVLQPDSNHGPASQLCRRCPL